MDYKMDMGKRIVNGLGAILIGSLDEFSINSRATIHGHYHPEDKKALGEAKALKSIGLKLLKGEYQYSLEN